MSNPHELEEIRDRIIRHVKDLPQEALCELFHNIVEIERFYSKSLPPEPPPHGAIH